MSRDDWLGASITGLAKLVEHRGKKFVLEELLQNAWDEPVKRVTATLELIEGRRAARIRVEDDSPDGYSDITHAFILFAESKKKSDPTKRGVFNLGEKLVLSLCESAIVSTTTGTLVFDEKGRHRKHEKRKKGSVFEGVVKMTKTEFEEVCAAAHRLIPPRGIVTTFNGKELQHRKPVKTFTAQLPTVISDDEGNLTRKTIRQTNVSVYEPLPDEVPALYEMGIPVVETNDKWHVDVQQKVPLNTDRDNVTPAYLRQIRTLVLNEMIDFVKGEDAASSWAKNALEDKDIKPETVIKLLDEIMPGPKAIFDPSDLESNNKAVASGTGLLKGRMFPKPAWDNIHKTGAYKPAGQLYPTSRIEFHPDGEELKIIDPKDMPVSMKRIVDFTKAIAPKVLEGVEITVEVCNNFNVGAAAFYGKRHFTYNVGRLGFNWFKQMVSDEEVCKLIQHELAHEIESNHLDEKYHDALCAVGARMVFIALNEPEFFKQFED